MDQVNAGAGAITQINANFQTVNPSGMYGRKASTSSGLTWGYQGGWFTDSIQIADGTIVVGASTTTYVVADRTTGAISSSTNTTNWNNTAAYIRIAVLVSGASGITSYTDRRPSLYNNSGGGGGGTVSTVLAGTGIDVDSTDPANPEVSLDSASQASLSLADSAVQPGDLATIATSGAAADASIVDAGGYFASSNVEGALQELGAGGGSGGVTIGASLSDVISGTTTLEAVDAGSDKVQGWDDSAGKSTYFNPAYGMKINGSDLRAPLQTIAVALSDRTTNLTTGTNKASFTMPYDFTVVEVQASVDTQQTAGSVLTFDVNEGGTSILSTKCTIDNNEDSSITAATSPVISDSSLAKGSKITWDIDQVGTAGARGAIGYLIGYPT